MNENPNDEQGAEQGPWEAAAPSPADRAGAPGGAARRPTRR